MSKRLAGAGVHVDAALAMPATSVHAPRLLLCPARRDWFEALAWLDVVHVSSAPDAASAADAITRSLLAAALVLLPAVPLPADGQLSQAQLRLQAVATQLLPLLLAACHRQPPQLVLVVSLATALIDRLVPPAAWLPLVRAHLHFGSLLHSMLHSMHAAAQAAAAQQHAAAQHQHQKPAAAAAGAAGVLALPAPPAVGTEQEQPQPLGLSSPLAAASVEEAVLLLVLQLAQTRSGAELLLEQGAVVHALALG